MKTASPELSTLLASGKPFVRIDLYTITLVGGLVLRWSSSDIPVTYSGHTFTVGPLIQDGGVQAKRGVEVATVDVTLYADERQTINGQPMLDFADGLGFDGATIKIERVFACTVADMQSAGPVGGYIRFAGRFSEIKDFGQTQLVVTAVSWMDLLSNNVPTDVYQTACANVLGDARCTIDLSTYKVDGTVSGTVGLTGFGSALTPAARDYELGKVVFHTGANAGVARTIKSHDTVGNFILSSPLPALPAAGDTFSVYPGCDLSMDRCKTRFANLIHYRGQPFIPTPTTGLPT